VTASPEHAAWLRLLQMELAVSAGKVTVAWIVT
jgi:hypothetical protein